MPIHQKAQLLSLGETPKELYIYTYIYIVTICTSHFLLGKIPLLLPLEKWQPLVTGSSTTGFTDAPCGCRQELPSLPPLPARAKSFRVSLGMLFLGWWGWVGRMEMFLVKLPFYIMSSLFFWFFNIYGINHVWTMFFLTWALWVGCSYDWGNPRIHGNHSPQLWLGLPGLDGWMPMILWAYKVVPHG